MTDKLKLEVSDEIAIKIESMNKWFGSFQVLDAINLSISIREKNGKKIGSRVLFFA